MQSSSFCIYGSFINKIIKVTTSSSRQAIPNAPMLEQWPLQYILCGTSRELLHINNFFKGEDKYLQTGLSNRFLNNFIRGISNCQLKMLFNGTSNLVLTVSSEECDFLSTVKLVRNFPAFSVSFSEVFLSFPR